MTISVGKLTPIYERIIAVKKGEVSKVRACCRRLCNIFKDEDVKDRFIMYLISEGRSIPEFGSGKMYLSRFKYGEDAIIPKNKFSEAELVLFGEILSIYDYLDEVTINILHGFPSDTSYVPVAYSSLFSEGLLNRVLSFFTDFFDRFRS